MNYQRYVCLHKTCKDHTNQFVKIREFKRLHPQVKNNRLIGTFQLKFFLGEDKSQAKERTYQVSLGSCHRPWPLCSVCAHPHSHCPTELTFLPTMTNTRQMTVSHIFAYRSLPCASPRAEPDSGSHGWLEKSQYCHIQMGGSQDIARTTFYFEKNGHEHLISMRLMTPPCFPLVTFTATTARLLPLKNNLLGTYWWLNFSQNPPTYIYAPARDSKKLIGSS